MRKILTIIIIAVVLCLGWAVYMKLVPAVDVVYPIRGPAVHAVYATGTVEPSVMMPIAARNTARLTKLNADEGEVVKQGQVLGQLEDEDLKQNIRQLQARENQATTDYKRYAKIAASGAVARQLLDQTKTELEAATAARRNAEVQAGYMKLLAPAEGLIIKRDGEIGQLIPANQPIFWLSCCAPLRISAEVDEEDISQVKPGQEVLIRADAFPGQVFHGRIEFIEKTPLQIGMTTETNIIIDENKEAILLPNNSIDQSRVWVIKDKKLKPQIIVTGAKGTLLTEVKSGIEMGDLIVLHAQARFKEGHKIHRINIVEIPKL